MIQYIASKSTTGAKYVLWRHGDYHYQIETQRRERVLKTVNLYDTSYEQAIKIFNTTIEKESA